MPIPGGAMVCDRVGQEIHHHRSPHGHQYIPGVPTCNPEDTRCRAELWRTIESVAMSSVVVTTPAIPTVPPSDRGATSMMSTLTAESATDEPS